MSPRPRSSRFLWRCLLLILLGTLAGGSLAQDAAVELRAEAQAPFDLLPGVRVLHDPPARLDADAAWRALSEGKFAALPNATANFGFSREALWFAVSVENRDQPIADWLLTIEQPRLDRIDIWVRRGADPPQQLILGDSLPFAARSVPHRFPNVALSLPPGDRAELLLRVESTSSIQLPLRLYTVASLFRASHDAQAGIGLYYGLLLALALYNLAVLLSIRDASYLYYVLYVASFGLLMLSFNGVGFQYLWPGSPLWQNASLPFSIGAVLCSSVAFANSFLDLRRNLPRLSRLLNIGIALFAALLLASFTRYAYQATIAFNIGVIGMSLLVTGAAIACARQGYRPAWYFLLAWTLLIAGGVALPLSSFGLFPRTVLTEYSVQFGSAAEMLLLSFSLAYRIHLLRNANERIEREARDTLERRVAERTEALASTAQRLETANTRLRETSLRDGLTGVWNRRHLDQALGENWHACHARRSPMSLLMIDIDHFKRINDDHGHVAGDDCLRAVATRIVSASDAGAVVARYGGEEFMVVLPDCDADCAQARAESVRIAIATAPVAIEGDSLPVTVSIGIASFDAQNSGSLLDLVRLSDQALYAAKRRGRNCVASA
ncbi:MAG: 7TM diverse intracellular signaling domain-containing protein [Tahibacter sp.]